MASPRHNLPVLRNLLLATTAAAAVLSFAGPASAKEIGSGGTPTGTACSPVSSLKALGDVRAGESAVASIDVDYAVKPCDSTQVVTVETTVAEYLDPTAVVWDDTAAPENGGVTVFGIKLRTTYLVTVTVRDAVTGALVGSATKSAAAVPKSRA